MSVPPLDVSTLEIVGYADVPAERAVPAIVPPVFRRKDNRESILVPPYSLSNGRYLCDATEISCGELESLAHRREVTLFESPRDAQRDYELWLDQQGIPQYQPRREARIQLSKIAASELTKAEAAFERSHFGDAERHSDVALLADPKNVDAWAIKMAIADVTSDGDSKELLRELLPENSLRAIDARVKDLTRTSSVHQTAPAAVGYRYHSFMSGMGTIPSHC